MIKNEQETISILKRGGVGVFPTDTLYGLVCSALNQKAVEKIYKIRRRDLHKPFIVLISSEKDLNMFGVPLNKRTRNVLRKLWPGPVSVILPLPAGRQGAQKFAYLHRGANTLAFRLPKSAWLRNILKKTGPLVAPSANIAGKPPARTIKEARVYFGNAVDFYIDRGKLHNPPSSLVEIKR